MITSADRPVHKICDVVCDGFLPIELHTEDLFSPHAVPEV